MISAVRSEEGVAIGKRHAHVLGGAQSHDEEKVLVQRLANGSVLELYTCGNRIFWTVDGVTRKILSLAHQEVPDDCPSTPRMVFPAVFHSYPNRPNMQGESGLENLGSSRMSVCFLEEKFNTLHIYYEEGEDFLVNVPFNVKNIWASKYGLILERETASSTSSQPLDTSMGFNTTFPSSGATTPSVAVPLPLWYTLMHPLDDFATLMTRTKNGKVKEPTTDENQIIFASSGEPPIVVTHNKHTGQHSAWLLNPASREDNEFILSERRFLEPKSPMPSAHQSPSFMAKAANRGASHTPSNSPISTGSPQSRNVSLNVSPWNLATISRSSPFVGQSSSSFINRAMAGGYEQSLNTSTNSDAIQSVPPNVALSMDQVWTEPAIVAKQNGGKRAVKVFLIRDTMDETYLCYLHAQCKVLAVVKYEVRSSNLKRPYFSAVTFIAAADAVPMEDQKMILVLEPQPQGQKSPQQPTLTLYSGLVKVAKVMYDASPRAGNMQMAHIAHEIGALHLDNSSCSSSADLFQRTDSSSPGSSKQSHASGTSSIPAPLESPANFPDFPSPIATASKSEAKTGMLTPKLDTGAAVTQLLNPIKNQATLRGPNGSLVRIYLPVMAESPLVIECLRAVVAALPKELAVQFQAKWYASRNAPGPPCISPSKEWKHFTQCLLGLLGYNIELLPSNTLETFATASSPISNAPSTSKKAKPSERGSDKDWEFLLGSRHHLETGQELSILLGLDNVTRTSGFAVDRDEEQEDEDGDEEDEEDSLPPLPSTRRRTRSQKRTANQEAQFESGSMLFQNFPRIVRSLHTLYEGMKLDKNCAENLPLLANLLARMTADLHLASYVHHYWSDFPSVCPEDFEQAKTGQLTKRHLSQLNLACLEATVPCILSYFKGLLDLAPRMTFPLHLSRRARELTVIYRAEFGPFDDSLVDDLKHFLPLKLDETSKILSWLDSRLVTPMEECDSDESLIVARPIRRSELIAQLLIHFGWDSLMLDTLPDALSLPLRVALITCRRESTAIMCPATNRLIGRHDLALHNSDSKDCPKDPANFLPSPRTSISYLLWPEDERLRDGEDMLCSSQPMPINIKKRPEVSDHEFVEEQKKALYSLSVRALAQSFGRGAFDLGTVIPSQSEPFPIPMLNLEGRAAPRGTVVHMEHIEIVPNMDKWPLFHNGAAAGLSIAPEATKFIDTTWIAFNKPGDMDSQAATANQAQNNGQEKTLEHSGFLLALGLRGHLAKLDRLEAFEYMIKGHEMINVGLLLGISASKRGSMDSAATKMISTQLVALLPPSSTELPLSHTTQIAALMSLGLLYQNTGNRHMAEICLGELGKPPGPEQENCTDRESYSLAAGLALGLITFGRGADLSKSTDALADLELPDMLYYHMIGGPRSAVAHKLKHAHSASSTAPIGREGEAINIDVTGPGATLALGMTFFRTGKRAIADWMLAPSTQHLLEFIRPDFLMLRTIARGLILWDDIEPSQSWLMSHIPDNILCLCLTRPDPENHPAGIDYETINQAYCNLTAGAALIMGIRFAGSANHMAFNTLYDHVRKLICVSKRSVAELAGRATLEQTICVHVLALAVVMAGTGDLDVFRLIRFLRSRVGPTHPTVTYGSHMALHMALGLLFVGSGKMSLSTEPMAVAAMLCAFYPKFPTHSNDNREEVYHLQALRHLYVLAAEPRLLAPRDALSGNNIYADFRITFAKTPWYDSVTMIRRAPCLLPELKLLSSVCLADDRYHAFSYESEEDLKTLDRTLKGKNGVLYLQLKAGCLPYEDDPHGFRSLTAQSVARTRIFQWGDTVNVSKSGVGGANASVIKRAGGGFSSAEAVKMFWDMIVKSHSGDLSANSSENKILLASLLYECATHETMELLPFWMDLFRLLERPKERLSGIQEKLVKLMLLFASRLEQSGILSPELMVSVQQKMVTILGSA